MKILLWPIIELIFFHSGSPLPQCFGFIDGTVRPICRPIHFQEVVYNGHKRVHALKYQAVSLPNGIIVHLSGPLEGRRHDAALLAQSNVLAEIAQYAGNHYIYGDLAYPLSQYLQCPFKGAFLTPRQRTYNKRMSKVRVSVEWAYKDITVYFAFNDFKKNQKLLLQHLGQQFIVSGLFTNCRTCLYGNQCSDYFDYTPPTLEEYLY